MKMRGAIILESEKKQNLEWMSPLFSCLQPFNSQMCPPPPTLSACLCIKENQ